MNLSYNTNLTEETNTVSYGMSHVPTVEQSKFVITMEVKIKKLFEEAIIPTRGSNHAAGYDLYATEDHTLMPMDRKLFKTGISMAIPTNTYGRIAPRSGLAYKDGLDVLAGVIDEDYRGDIGVILINLGDKEKKISKGDKIAQIIFETYHVASLTEVDDLDATNRGEGGFGSTDKANLNGMLEGMEQPDMNGVDEEDKGSNIVNMYKKAGGIPVKNRYIDEIKRREE
jgi:dUTP pyrophosphatase